MDCYTCIVCKKSSSLFYPNNKSTCKPCNIRRTTARKEAKKAAADGNIDSEKRCCHCKLVKPGQQFNKDSSVAGGLQRECRSCSTDTGAKHRQLKRQRDPEGTSLCNTCGKETANVDFQPTKQQCRSCLAAIKRDKWATDPQYRCKELASARYRRELKKYGMDKTRAISQLIGCSPAELRQHIESQFREGMSWDNHGNGKGYWNLDHIIACARFDLTKEAEQNKCFHYTNLQPLWWIDNMRKGAKLDWLPELAEGVKDMMRG